MATKTKTSEPPAPKPVPSVERTFAEGLGHLNAGNLAAATKAFTLVEGEAAAQERLNLARTARSYLAAIQARLQEQGTASKAPLEMEVQLMLNRRGAEAALARLEPALKAAPQRAPLHYLKAVAHAQLGQGPESAESLSRAVALDADLLYQFRLEPDFDALRQSGTFASLLRG
jgi:hypothetical protein